MYDREELAEVYYDLPRLPVLDLVERVLALLDARDEASLRPFRERLRKDGRRADPLVPEHLLEDLTLTIDPAGADQPLGWHLHRLLARARSPLEPLLTPDAADVVRRHADLLGRWAGEEPASFLYQGLRARSLDAACLAHVRAHAGDLEAAAFLGRSYRGEHVPADVAAPILAGVLGRALAEAEAGEEPDTLRVPRATAIPAAAREWVRAVLQRPDAMSLLATVPVALPVRLLDAVERHPLFDAGELPCPREVDEALGAIAALAKAQPDLQPILAVRVERIFGTPRAERVREVASAGVPLLAAVVKQGWTEPLSGAEALVAPALTIEDPATRVDALVAIGAPAVGALEGAADADVALLSGDTDPHAGRRLAKLVAHVPGLGLGFWWKRLDRPGVFAAIASTSRIRAALAIEPRPLHRLLRSAARGDAPARVGVEALVAVSRERGWSLAPVAEEVLALLVTPEGSALPWYRRLSILGAVGTPGALAAAVAEVDRARPAAEDVRRLERDVQIVAAFHDALWEHLVGTGHVAGMWLLPWYLERGDDDLLGAAALRSLFDTLADLPDEVSADDEEAATALTNRVARLYHLAKDHAAALGDARVQRGIDAVEAAGHPELATALRRAPNPRRGAAPWRGLLDADLAEYLPQLASWAAAALVEAARRGDAAERVPVPVELRRGLLARCRRALGADAEGVLAALGDRWPSPAALRGAAERAEVRIPDATFDRCADEVLPALFRAAVAALPGAIDRPDEVWVSPVHELVRWTLEEAWAEDPALAAKHLLPCLEEGPEVWRRGVALALVALREPHGNDVADALTRAAHVPTDPSLKEFLLAQRDTFARDRVARERRRPAAERTQAALLRLLKYARRS